MKQIKFLGMLLIALTMCVGFNSCSEDEPKWNDNPAKAIQGTYVGNGKLSWMDIIDEEVWNGMKVDVVRSSNEYVILTLRFANGTTILQSDRVYNVIETSTGYMLRDSNAPNVEVTIDKSGYMHYYNPNISVGDESGYSITFDGRKEY